MQNTNRELFEETPIPVAVQKMMIPTIIGALVTVLYSLADTLFVGMINDEIQNAAVALAAPALLAFNAVNNLFGVGSSSMMSRALGRGDMKTVRESASFGFYGAVASGALLSALCLIFMYPFVTLLGGDASTAAATISYMRWAVVCGAIPTILNVVMGYMVRSEGAVLHASIGTMSGCILNMILDPIFILPWGFGMGAAGAGFATFLSNCFACCYFFVLLFARKKKNKTNINLNPKYISLKKNIVLGVMEVGVPAAIQNLLNVTGMTILNNFVAGYGSSAVAAIGIAQKVYMVPIQVAIGGTQGVMPLVGYSYASRNKKRFEETIRTEMKILIPCMVTIMVLCWIFAPSLITLFMKNEEVIAYGTIFLRGFCLCMPFMVIDFLAVGVFQSVGMGKTSLLFAILRKIILEIPAIILLNKLFHAAGITYAGSIAEFILSICAVILLRRIVKSFDARQAENDVL